MSIVLQGSTSGSITLQEPAVAGSTVLDLPATSGTILTTGSSGQSIPKAALPTGSVLQVVNVTYSTETITSSSTFVDTNLSASITPTSATSKILVLADNNGCYKITNDTNIKMQLVRGSTALAQIEGVGAYTANTTQNNIGSISTNYLDSPATTSSVTYKMQMRSDNGASVGVQRNSSVSTMTLLEIAA